MGLVELAKEFLRVNYPDQGESLKMIYDSLKNSGRNVKLSRAYIGMGEVLCGAIYEKTGFWPWQNKRIVMEKRFNKKSLYFDGADSDLVDIVQQTAQLFSDLSVENRNPNNMW